MRKMPEVNCSRGAPKGRYECAYPPTDDIKLHIAEVVISNDGYDNGGAYWGTGERLFMAHAGCDYPDIEYYTRARNKIEAVKNFKNRHPTMVFRNYKWLEETNG